MSEAGEILLAVASKVPLLVGRLVRTFFGTLRRSRRAASTFRRALKRNGMDAQVARRLSRRYRDHFSLRRLLTTVMRAARSD